MPQMLFIKEWFIACQFTQINHTLIAPLFYCHAMEWTLKEASELDVT